MRWLARYFELSRSSAGHNLRPMEGLRGFAVFLVFLVHYSTLVMQTITQGSDLDRFLHQVHALGNAGVDLFFVLSGYLIYGSLMDRSQDYFGFLRRRIKRIYPVFCVVFVIYLVLSFQYPAESKIPDGDGEAWLYILQNLLLLPGVFPIEPMITVAWSLSYEMLYYIVLPIVMGLFGIKRRSKRWRVVFFSVIAIGILLYCGANGGRVRLAMFLSGILLYEALLDKTAAAPRCGLALLILIGGMLAAITPFPGTAGDSIKMAILFSTFFVVCHACFSQPDSWFSRGFGWTPMRWLGNMSYSYYLLHGLALKVGGMLLFSRLTPAGHETFFVVAMLPLLFVLTLLPATFIYLLIERPFSLVKTRPVLVDEDAAPVLTNRSF
jgi:peptidoglycan/LPS O-acetylase OafA/YrhL